MSNEIAERGDDGTLEVFPPARPRQSTAVAALHEHAEVYNTAWKLAGQLVRTTLIPKRLFGKQADAAAAILYGAELGLKPWQSVQRVIPIHGMPTLEARTMVGLLKQAGYKVRTVEQSDESVTVVGRDRDGDEYASTWTIERAKRAGYVPTPAPGVENPDPLNDDDWLTVEKFWDGKKKVSVLGNMKYVTDPQTMLKAKAQAEVCREMAPDVLMGLGYTREDLESEPDFDTYEPPAKPAAAPVTVDEIFADEVPLSSDQDGAVADNPPAAPHQTPAGAEDQDVENTAPLDDPAPAEQSPSDSGAKPDTQQVRTPAEPDPVAEAETAEKAKKVSKSVAAKRSTAPAADPDKVKSKMREALEKRVFTMLGGAGLTGDKDRDGRLAVYAAILKLPAVGSTNDLDDVQLTAIGDQLYRWQAAKTLDDEIGAILMDAARDEEQAAAPAEAAPTSEGTE